MQDNQSCILLQKNYPYSNGKGSKHIDVQYFFVVDKIKNEEVKIVYCPTEKMIADFSSKPTQRKLFEFQRNTIQGIKLRISDCTKSGTRRSFNYITYSIT